MINLLKADFFRVLRTKIVYVSLIIAVVLPVFIALVNGLTEIAVRELTREMEPDVQFANEIGDSMLSSAFSPLMSFSYIFAVFPVIVIMMDFGNGTLRNKVIHGYTRHQIYLAHFIVTLVHIAAITLIFTITTIVGALIFRISPVPADFIPAYVLYYVIGFLTTVLVASLGCCLALSLGNAGAIVLAVIGTLVLTNAGDFLHLIFVLNEVEHMEHLLCFFPCYFTGMLSPYLADLAIIPLIEPMYIVEAVAGVLLLSGGFYALGTFIFSKRDFK